MALDTLVAPAQQSVSYPLDSPKGLRLHNVSAQATELLGKKGIFVTMADEALSRLKALPGEQRGLQTVEQLAVVEGLSFGSGVCEAWVVDVTDTRVLECGRGFVGIAFRVH